MSCKHILQNAYGMSQWNRAISTECLGQLGDALGTHKTAIHCHGKKTTEGLMNIEIQIYYIGNV